MLSTLFPPAIAITVLISITIKAVLERDINESQMDYLGTFDKNQLTVHL